VCGSALKVCLTPIVMVRRPSDVREQPRGGVVAVLRGRIDLLARGLVGLWVRVLVSRSKKLASTPYQAGQDLGRSDPLVTISKRQRKVIQDGVHLVPAVRR
jgi:hypothetical protein